MENYKKYVKLKADLARGKKWRAHIGASGRCSEIGKISGVSCHITIALQYDTGGQNYWLMNEDGSEEYQRAFEEAVKKNFKLIADDAEQLLQGKIDALKASVTSEIDKLKQELAA